MSRFIEINGKKYKARPMDFNTACDLEELGVSISDFRKKPTAFVRAYTTLCIGSDPDYAGNELEAHIVSGGSFSDIIKVVAEELDESDFFRAMFERKETETRKVSKKTQKVKAIEVNTEESKEKTEEV